MWAVAASRQLSPSVAYDTEQKSPLLFVPVFSAMEKRPRLGEARALVVFGGDACESNTPETFCAPHNGFEGRGAHQDPSISAWSERTRARCRFMIAHNRAEHLHFPEEREKPRRGVQGAPKAEAVQTALSNSPRARRPNAAGRRLPAHAARPRAWAGNPPCGGRERSA